MGLIAKVSFTSIDQKTLKAYGTITASGNYAFSGIALSFAGLVSGVAHSPKSVRIYSASGSGWIYQYVVASGKMMVMGVGGAGAVSAAVALTELAATTLPVSVSGDDIRFEATFERR